MRSSWQGCVAVWLMGWVVGAWAQVQNLGYVDDSLEATELLAAAERLRGEDELERAAALLDEVLAGYATKLHAVANGDEGGGYADVRLVVEGRLRADGALRAAYERAVGAAALVALRGAEASGDLAALDAVRRRYGATRAGLTAALHRAAAALAAGDGRGAALVLDAAAGHPALAADDGEAQRYAALRAAVGRRLGGGAVDVAGLPAGWAAQVSAIRPVSGEAVASATPGVVTRAQRGVSWRVDARETLSVASAALGASRGRRGTLGGRGTAGLAMHGGVVLASSSESVAALDAWSGRVRWRYGWESPLSALDASDVSVVSRLDDPRPVAVAGSGAGGVVFAVMGGETARVRRDLMSPSALVALSLASGEALWSVRPEDVDPGLGGLGRVRFAGPPVYADGRVYAVIADARNQQATAWVVAVDAGTGVVVWHRLLATLTLRNVASGSSPARLAAAGGRVYAADLLGHLACFAGLDGTAMWLSSPVEPGVPNRGANGTRNLAPPVPVSGGVLAPRSRTSDGYRLVDAETGATLRASVREAPWLTAAAVVSVDDAVGSGDALVVGVKTVRYDGRTLEPVWSAELGAATLSAVGWARVGDTLWVQVRGGWSVLSVATGEVLAEWEGPDAASVVGSAGVLVAADAGVVQGFVDGAWAVASLRAAAAADPGAVQPWLSLLRLAAEAGGAGDSTEGSAVGRGEVREAVEALGRVLAGRPAGDAERVGAFGELLALVEPGAGGAAPAWVVEPVASMLVGLAATPGERARLALADAARATGAGRPGEAVAALQRVLDEPAASGQVVTAPGSAGESPGVGRQAGLEARRRLALLVEAHGAGVYAEQLGAARAALGALRGAGAEPGAFAALADRYPIGRPAVEALREAATGWSARGEPGQAVGALRRAYASASSGAGAGLGADDATALAVVSELVRQYERQGDASEAAAWLRRAVRRYGAETVVVAGEGGDERTLGAWLEAVEGAPAEAGEPGAAWTGARVVPGGLLAATGGGNASGGWLTRDGGVVRWHPADEGVAGWSLAAEGVEDLGLLDARAGRAVLWSAGGGGLQVVDTATGGAMWPPVSARGALDRAAAAFKLGVPEQERQWLLDFFADLRGESRAKLRAAWAGGPLRAAAVGPLLVVADGLGRVMAVDRDTGQTLWQVVTPVDRVVSLSAAEDRVLVVGETGAASEVVSATALVLDAWSGRVVLGPVDEPGEARWGALVGDGGLALRASDAVWTGDGVALVRGDGFRAARWRGVAGAGGRGLARDAELVVGGGVLVAVTPGVGRVPTRVEVFGDVAGSEAVGAATVLLGAPAVRVGAAAVGVAGGVAVLTAEGVVVIDGEGHAAWRSATDGTDAGWFALASDGARLALVGVDAGLRDRPHWRVLLLDAATGRAVQDVLVPAPAGWVPAAHWAVELTGAGLAVSNGVDTVLVTGGPGGG